MSWPVRVVLSSGQGLIPAVGLGEDHAAVKESADPVIGHHRRLSPVGELRSCLHPTRFSEFRLFARAALPAEPFEYPVGFFCFGLGHPGVLCFQGLQVISQQPARLRGGGDWSS